MVAAHVEVDIYCIGHDEEDRGYSGNVEDIGLEDFGVNLAIQGIVERGRDDETKAPINCG
jgi:hypothetical protein